MQANVCLPLEDTVCCVQVATMQRELEELQPKLVTAQDENARMMVVIEKENVEVEARSKVVRKDEEAANKEAAVAQALKDEVCGHHSILIYPELQNLFSVRVILLKQFQH